MTTATQEDVKRFLRGITRKQNKQLMRHIVYLVSQGHWGSIAELAGAVKFPKPLSIADIKAVLDPKGKVTDTVVFLNRLAANKTLRQKVAALPEKDWEMIAAIAKGEGLDVRTDELKTLIPESLYTESGAQLNLR